LCHARSPAQQGWGDAQQAHPASAQLLHRHHRHHVIIMSSRHVVCIIMSSDHVLCIIMSSRHVVCSKARNKQRQLGAAGQFRIPVAVQSSGHCWKCCCRSHLCRLTTAGKHQPLLLHQGSALLAAAIAKVGEEPFNTERLSAAAAAVSMEVVTIMIIIVITINLTA
jgi:hypothetical protein